MFPFAQLFPGHKWLCTNVNHNIVDVYFLVLHLHNLYNT